MKKSRLYYITIKTEFWSWLALNSFLKINSRERKVVPVLANANAPTATNLVFPIPSSEVTRSGGKIKQNAGY